jgi:hypothetical protein
MAGLVLAIRALLAEVPQERRYARDKRGHNVEKVIQPHWRMPWQPFRCDRRRAACLGVGERRVDLVVEVHLDPPEDRR